MRCASLATAECELSFTPMSRVTLKAGHVRPVFAGHPWVFQQAIDRIEGGAQAGDEVDVVDPQGNFLGVGLYSPQSAIPVRLFAREKQAIGGALFRRRIVEAQLLRKGLGLPSRDTTGYRLVHGEGDRLPGLIVDVFGDVVCVQTNTIGVKRREGAIFEILGELLHPRAIFDRTPEVVKKLEGFAPASGVVRGDRAIDRLAFRERGFAFTLPASIGQKTGYYFDQRELRARVEAIAREKTVLDAYSFVGGFALAAARGGAKEVLAVDESAEAITLGAEIARENGFADRIAYAKQDALRALGDASQRGGYDLVLCDPPKLAPARANKNAALTTYRMIARSACRATKVGGTLVLSSCSGAVTMDELIRALTMGAADARMHATLLERHTQGPDHPVPTAFPEGLYLKSVIAHLSALD